MKVIQFHGHTDDAESFVNKLITMVVDSTPVTEDELRNPDESHENPVITGFVDDVRVVVEFWPDGHNLATLEHDKNFPSNAGVHDVSLKYSKIAHQG